MGCTQAQIYSSTADDVRDVWAVDVTDARLLFTGAATDDEFRELIEVAVGTEAIPRG